MLDTPRFKLRSMNNDKQKSAINIIRWKVLIRFLALLTLLYGANVFSGIHTSHPWNVVYGSFYNGHFYLGVGNSFAVLPNVSGPFHLAAQIIKNTFKSLLMSRGILSRSFYASGSLKYTGEKMVDCSLHQVAIEEPVLRSLLSIQTGCINEADPLWIINASPVWDFSVPGFKARELQQVPLYRLYKLMHEHRLRFITLQPSRKINGASGSDNGMVTAYTCTHHGTCFAIEFDFAMGEQKWLLEELLVRTHEEPKPIPWRKNSDLKISSVLEQAVINPVVDGLSCLLDHPMVPWPGQDLSCKGNQRIKRHDDFKWRFIAADNQTLHLNWIHVGAGYRILPLQPCRQGAGKNIWQCPSHLVWSQDTSSWSEFAESVPVLSIRRDAHMTNYQVRYFDYDFYGIGSFQRNTNHAEKLLKYFIVLPASFSVFASGGVPGTGNELVSVQQGGPLMPLANVAITSSLLSGTVKNLQTLKDGEMEPVNIPTEKPQGRGRGGVFGRGIIHGGGNHLLHGPGNGRGRGNHLHPNGRGGRGNGGYGPPYPGGAQLQAEVNRHDIYDMLRQLFDHGFKENFLPITLDLAAAITESIHLDGHQIGEFRFRMEEAFRHQAGSLEGRLTQPVQKVFDLLMIGRFDPLNVNQVIMLAELTGQDLLIFIASTPGLHGYKYYRRGSLEVLSGDLNDPLPKIDSDTLALAYSPHPLAFKRVGLPVDKSGRILPLGVDELLLSYRHFMPPSFATDTDVKGLINSVLLEYYSDATLALLHQTRHHLARAGLLSFCPVERMASDRYFYSKTLLENIEWYWQNNRERLLTDQTLFFKALENSKVEQELRASSRMRFDQSMGQVGESVFETMFFVDMALPAMRNLVETQHQIVGILMDILKKRTFSGERGWRAAVYGGAATRSHLLVHSFMGDLDLAVRQGAMSVNDVDVMVSSELMRDMLVTLLKERLRKDVPSLNLKEVTLDKGGLHTYILKICYDWTRVFSIDITYSDDPDYFDFSDVAPMLLPAYQGSRGAIDLPVIGLKNLLSRMVHESNMPGEDDETARRRASARWNLQLFAKGDDSVKVILEELMPSKPVLPDIVPKESEITLRSPDIDTLDEPMQKIPPSDPGLTETIKKELPEPEQDDPETLVRVKVVTDKEPEAEADSFHQLVDAHVRKKKNDKGRRERVRRRKKQAEFEAMQQSIVEEVVEEVVQENVRELVSALVQEEKEARRNHRRLVRVEALKQSVTDELMEDVVQEEIRDIASLVLQEELEADATKISEPSPEAAPESSEKDAVVKLVIPKIRTEEFLDDPEEKPHWPELLAIVSHETELPPCSSGGVEEPLVETDIFGDGTGSVSVGFSETTTATEPSAESALTFLDFYQIISDSESEFPGITDSDMQEVSTRLISDIESDHSQNEPDEVVSKDEPEENRLETLWQQANSVHMDCDLYGDPNKPEPVLGWATFLEEYTKGKIYLTKKFILHLSALQARAVRGNGFVTVLLEAAALKNTGLAGLNFRIPDYSYLDARTMPWNINDGRLLLALYRARYFYQAFPHLVAILGDPQSQLYQPVSLVKMAKEFNKAAYPANRRYEIMGDIPVWPEPDLAIKRVADLLMADDVTQPVMLKVYSRVFLADLEQGRFHAGLGMVILQLGGFSQTQKNFLASRVAYEFHSEPGAQWLLGSLQSPKRVEPDGYHLYLEWRAFRNRYKKDLPDVTELKALSEQFRSLIGPMTEKDRDYLPEQLMILDDELYMKFAWLGNNMRGYKKRNASQDDFHGYVLLGHMLLSVYFHLEQNVEFMMSVSRLRQFRGLAKIRGELDSNYQHTDLIDQGIFSRFLLRLHSAWDLTHGDQYLRTSAKLLDESKDENSAAMVEWFHEHLK